MIFTAPPLDTKRAIVDQQGRPTLEFQAYLTEFANAILIAGGAVDKVEEVVAGDALAKSFPSGFAGSLVTADSSGLVTIANHTRDYGNGSSVSVTGGSVVTGLAAGSIARIYYDQASRAGGVVAYQFSTDVATVAQIGNRHSVGAVEIPASGTSDGVELPPPGGFYF